MANWSYLTTSEIPYNPKPEEYKVDSLYQGKSLVPIFWYLLFESDDFTVYEQKVECDNQNKNMSYAAFTSEKSLAVAHLKEKRPFLNMYLSSNLLSSLDTFIDYISKNTSKYLSVEAREISIMYEEPQHFAEKIAGLLVRLNMVCTDKEIEYDRKELIKTVLDAELRDEEEGICLYTEVDGKFDADPAFFTGLLSKI